MHTPKTQAEIGMAYFDFFIELSANNSKGWFDEHRSIYETQVKKPFTALVETLITAMAKDNPELAHLRAADCMFRINRDIRFAKDKTPYKTYMAAVISPGGRKDENRAGFYFQIGPELCAVYMGVYQPDKTHLGNIRNYLMDHSDALNALLGKKAFKDIFGEIRGEVQARLPSPWKEAATKHALIGNKQWYFVHTFEPEQILEQAAAEYLLNVWKQGQAVNDFFNRAATTP
jgi:uncharacterized protein (TIGR02453 family)